MEKKCDCGQLLHYSSPETRYYVEEQIRRLGSTVRVSTQAGCWLVPRHYIALHGIKGYDVKELAIKYKWPEVNKTLEDDIKVILD